MPPKDLYTGDSSDDGKKPTKNNPPAQKQSPKPKKCNKKTKFGEKVDNISLEAALTDDKSENESTSMTNKERFTIENAITFLYSPLLPDERK